MRHGAYQRHPRSPAIARSLLAPPPGSRLGGERPIERCGCGNQHIGSVTVLHERVRCTGHSQNRRGFTDLTCVAVGGLISLRAGNFCRRGSHATRPAASPLAPATSRPGQLRTGELASARRPGTIRPSTVSALSARVPGVAARTVSPGPGSGPVAVLPRRGPGHRVRRAARECGPCRLPAWTLNLPGRRDVAALSPAQLLRPGRVLPGPAGRARPARGPPARAARAAGDHAICITSRPEASIGTASRPAVNLVEPSAGVAGHGSRTA